jgi:trehalose 6-phosphate phosphatase
MPGPDRSAGSAGFHPLGLPPPARAALLLDMDGTLLDIAPRPELVRVPSGLPEALLALRARLDDALAIVTGRPIAQVDALLPGIPHAVAGEHGGAIRHAPDAAPVHAALPPAPAAWKPALAAIAERYPAALIENKTRGVVLHYREAPALGPELGEAAQALAASAPGFVVLAAHMAWEIKPKGADKGTAVRALMAQAPFAGRLPIFIGDDVTDEDGIAAAVALGGAGLRVADAFVDAAGVRAWLAAAASGDGTGWPA